MKVFAALILLLFATKASAAVTVATSQYDIGRTGANTAETVLNRANLATVTLKGSFTMDGKTYSQPLVIPGISGRRIVIQSSMHATIKAFDADHPGTNALWTFVAGTPLSQSDYPNINDLYHDEVGCMSTGVVNTANNTILATCVTTEHSWRLYCLNLTDGTEFHAPYTFTGSDNGVTFDSAKHLQRSALLLVGGNVITCFTGYGDNSVGTSPYQGWCFANDALTLARTGIKSLVSTAGGMAGIWMSGGGPASDGLDLYLITGNGDYNGTTDFANSLVLLSGVDLLLEVLDWATPSDWSTVLNPNDRDWGSGKVMYIGSGRVVGAGKDGRLFTLRTSQLGHLQGVGAGPLQVFNAQNGAVFGGTVFANGSIILAANNTTMKRYDLNTGSGTFNTTASAIGGTTYSNPAPSLSYTSNGSDTTTGIAWGVTPAGSAFSSLQVGTLRAWNASTLAEIASWSDSWNISKFANVTVADGDIFVPTFSNLLVVYGPPVSRSVSISGKVTISGKASIQ